MDHMNPYSFELSNFSFAVFGDAVVANYRLESKSLTNPKEIILGQITDTLVRRNGKWQLLAEHDSSIPNPIEPVISGMPNSWQRTTGEGADRYQITVDNSVKHSGNASATIKLLCGSDRDIWVALIQSITGNEYHAKRIRLSGWMKTDDVSSAGLLMRVDGERHMLAFDNMANRSITGTTDWKMYSVVLDVPADAQSIHFGVISSGPGQTWADDLKLEVVDNNVPSTNIASPEEIKEDQPKMMKTKVASSRPLNLGFEDGVVH
jgi:serine/threonine-protein kinase